MTDEAATSPPEALTIDSWQIWHVYSTYLPKPIENIHQAAAQEVLQPLAQKWRKTPRRGE